MDSKKSETTSQEKVPTKEEIMNFLQEQIDVKERQSVLQELNTKIAMDRFLELEAIAKIAHMTNPKSDPGQPHIVTEEDLQNNPELAEAGVKAGDEIRIPSVNTK